MFDGWLKIQLQGQGRHGAIETDHGPATFTTKEMQGISEVHSLTVDVESLSHEIVLLKMQVANRKQTLKSRNHRVPWQFVGPTQHPFQLKHHRDRHIAGRAGINQSSGQFGLGGIVVNQQTHQHVGVQSHWQGYGLANSAGSIASRSSAGP